jgi:hypothetical protein
MRSLKVRPDAVVEIGGFTHVENILRGVSHKVDAGAVGQAFQLLSYKVTSQLCSSGNILVYSSIADTSSKEYLRFVDRWNASIREFTAGVPAIFSVR